MFKKLTHRMDNDLYAIKYMELVAGVAIIMIGVFLWIDRTYFFWPPELKTVMNNEYVDVLFVVLGCGVILSALTGNRNKAFQFTFLIVSALAVFLLAVTQLLHVTFASEVRMGPSIILDLTIFALIFWCLFQS